MSLTLLLARQADAEPENGLGENAVKLPVSFWGAHKKLLDANLFAAWDGKALRAVRSTKYIHPPTTVLDLQQPALQGKKPGSLVWSFFLEPGGIRKSADWEMELRSAWWSFRDMRFAV